MSLPRPRPSERRSFQHLTPQWQEADHTVVMPAITKLRAAGDDPIAIEDAINAIPHPLWPRVLAFASDRPELVTPATLDLLASLVGIGAPSVKAGKGCAKVSRRGAATS